MYAQHEALFERFLAIRNVEQKAGPISVARPQEYRRRQAGYTLPPGTPELGTGAGGMRRRGA